MMFFHKKSSKLREFLSRINPLRAEGFLEQLKDRIFIKQARSKRRRNAIILASLYIILNLVLFTAVYKEYENYAYNSKTVELTTAVIDDSQLRDKFSESFGLRDDSPFTPYTVLAIISTAILILVIEYAALRVSHKHFAWRTYSITKSVVLFIAFQALYIVPISLILTAETQVVNVLVNQAGVDFAHAKSVLKSQSNTDKITYGLAGALAKVESTTSPVTILGGDYDLTVFLNAQNIEPVDSFYRAVILPFVVNNDQDFSVPTGVVFFHNNKIAISNTLAITDLEQILSALAIHSLRYSSLGENIKVANTPTISFLEESVYNQLEHTKIETRKRQFQAYLASISESIQEHNKYITSTEETLSKLRLEKTQYEERVRPLLNDCLREYGESECREPSQIVANSLAQYDQDITQLETYLAEAKTYVPILNRQYISAKSSYDQFLAYPITPELQAGLFESPNSIFIKHVSAEDVSPSRYYYTLLHELVHYYSYKKIDDTPTFIEEGMTDLLSLNAGQVYADSKEKVDGYPDEIKIAQELVAMLGEDKAIEVFIAKSRSKWQRELDALCGVGCYKKLETVGEQLTYADLNDTETRKTTLNTALEILKTN